MIPAARSEHVSTGRVLLRAFLSLTRPIIALNYVAGAPTRMVAGVPDDAPHGLIEGPRPLHLLVVGGLSGSPVGVRSYEQGVAHQCAKGLAKKTGRGVEWESLASVRPRLAGTAAALRGFDGLGSFDFIVLSPGTLDVLSFASIRQWERELEGLLSFLAEKTSPRTAILVTRILDISAFAQVGPTVRSILRDDSRRFSEVAAEICTRIPKAEMIDMPPVEKSDFVDDAFSYATLYRRWGEFLASIVTAHLDRSV